MAKTVFLCASCGYKSSKWLGKCPECGTWNSFVEEIEVDPKKNSRTAFLPDQFQTQPIPLSEISFQENSRFFTRITELDRVLGGIIPGQAILLSGEPGIGKSTLVLMLAGKLAEQKKVFYINGEESNSQVKLRAVRLGLDSKNLFLYSENNADKILEIGM